MKPNNTLLVTLSCIMLVGLAGCAKYKAHPLRPIAAPEQLADQSVSFSYRMLSTSECMKYLGRDTIAKGYQPIHVTITNNTDRYFNLSLNSFNCHCIDPQEVSQAMHTNTTGRAVGYGVPGVLLFPVLIIPAIVDGVGSSKANKKLDADYDRKALYTQTIQPYTTINGLIFISTEEHSRHMAVTIVDAASMQNYVLSRTKPVVGV